MKLRNLSLACALALPLFIADNAAACGADPYIGQVCYFTYNWGCPQDTLPADGRTLQVSQYQALFSLIGCSFGGNCSSTFNLPDLRGRAAVGVGQGPGLSNVAFAQQRGTEQVTLSQNQLPAHTHAATVNAKVASATTGTPAAGMELGDAGRTPVYVASSASGATAALGNASVTVSPAGSSTPVTTLPPELGLQACIVINGLYPMRP